MAVKEVHGPGPRGARGPRPKVENPGKLLKRIMDEVFRNYLPHCILVLVCIVVSALANVPINQSIAITGSVDQFGRVQPVGGLNEKIEGFFTICQQRGLTGKQGVIIPSANVRHLSLAQELRQAVADEQFFIWAIDDVTEALPLLTQLQWDGEGQTLRQTIQERIAQAMQQETRHRFPWPLRWLGGSNSN